MTVAQMVELVRVAAQGKAEKPTKGLTSWTDNRALAETMSALGFTVVETPSKSKPGTVYWKLNCNGNRFRAIILSLRAAGAPV